MTADPKAALSDLQNALDELYGLSQIVLGLSEADETDEHEVLQYIGSRLSEHEKQVRAAFDVLWDAHHPAIMVEPEPPAAEGGAR